jgi:hypothetical protein
MSQTNRVVRHKTNASVDPMAWKDTPEGVRGIFWIAMIVGVGLLGIIAIALFAEPGVP